MRILFHLVDQVDCRVLIETSPNSVQVSATSSTMSLLRELRSGADLVVYQLGTNALDDSEVAELIESLGIRLMVRLSAWDARAEEFARIITRFPETGISLQFRGERPESVRALYAAAFEPDFGPVGRMFAVIPGCIEIDARPVVLTALVLGRRRAALADFARLMDIAPRTCQAMTQRFGLPTPYRLLRWGQAAWTIWRMRRWGYSCKRAASAAGFERASTMSAALRTITRLSPTEAAILRGPHGISDDFREELMSQSTPQAVAAP